MGDFEVVFKPVDVRPVPFGRTIDFNNADDSAVFLSVEAKGSLGSEVLDFSSGVSFAGKIEMSSTTQGFLPPRVTTIEKDAISSPDLGLEVYDTDNKDKEIFDGTNWAGPDFMSLDTNKGYVVLPTMTGGIPGDGVVGVGTAKEVVAVQFVLESRVRFQTLRIFIDTFEASEAFDVGIFATDAAHTKLISTGPLSAASVGVQSVVLGSVEELAKGSYYIAFTSDSTVALMRGISFSSGDTLSTLMNVTGSTDNRVGVAANAATGAAASITLPATLGNVSDDPSVTISPVLFVEL